MGRRRPICPRMDADRRNAISNIEQVHTEFKCPICNAPNKASLMYIPHKRGKEHPSTTTATWCSRCKVRTSISYRCFKRRDGTPRLKIYHLRAADREFRKRFKVLA